MKNFFYLAVFGVIFASCQKEDETPSPSACFTVDKTGSTDPGHNFVFTNCSKNYGTVAWDFGDGHSSSEHSPSHTFNTIGEYTVTLTVTNTGSGLTSTNTRTITLGHYTLTKIVYNKLNTEVNYPRHAYLSRYSSSLVMAYNDDATVSSASQIPFTVMLPDDVIYDNHYSFYYRFSENDFAGHSYITNYFDISDLDIVNGKVDKTFVYSGDSARVSLYFIIVPR